MTFVALDIVVADFVVVVVCVVVVVGSLGKNDFVVHNKIVHIQGL